MRRPRFLLRELPDMMSTFERGLGKAVVVREVVYKSAPNADKGSGGGQKSEQCADIISGSSLTAFRGASE